MKILEEQVNLDVYQDEVVDIILDNNAVSKIKQRSGYIIIQSQ